MRHNHVRAPPFQARWADCNPFQTTLVLAVSVWKTTSRMSNKDSQPTFNCLLLQFGVVAQGVQELADLMHEVENQPASTILQVCCSDLLAAQSAW